MLAAAVVAVGRHDGVVHVTPEREVAVERADVGRGHADDVGELPLNPDVGLVGVGPVEIQIDAEDSAARGKRAVVRERRTAGIVVVRVAERGALRHSVGVHGPARVGEGQSSGPGLEIGHRVPLVAGDAAVEHAAGRPDGGAAVAERIPHDARPRRDVVPFSRDDPALHARGRQRTARPSARRG